VRINKSWQNMNVRERDAVRRTETIGTHLVDGGTSVNTGLVAIQDTAKVLRVKKCIDARENR